MVVHYEINDGSIRIIYGSHEESSGVFLTVIDRRLQSKPEASDEANKVVKEISSNGFGYYLHLHTGTGGCSIGMKVSNATMADFMGRYGVPKERIDELLGLYMYNQCLECKKATKLRCSKCKWKFYCSKECYQVNWPRHKHFCNINMLPEKQVEVTSSKKSVYGVLLMPEKEAKPKFVEVTLNLEHVDGNSFWIPDIDGYIRGIHANPLKWGGGYGVRTGSRDNPMYGGDTSEHYPHHMENTLQFHYRATYQIDGSKLNECVYKITDGKVPGRWAGPILVLKVQKKNWTEANSFEAWWLRLQQEEFMDVKLEDCEDIIDFFMLCGK